MHSELRDLRNRIEKLNEEVTELENLLTQAEIRQRLSGCYKRLSRVEQETAHKDKRNLNDIFLEMLICN